MSSQPSPLQHAQFLKSEGNQFFHAANWSQALASYHSALSTLPPRSQSSTPSDINSDDQPQSELQQQCATARAILYANIAACHLKLYVKALQRRAFSNEALNTWSSLSAAQQDYETLLTLLPESDTRSQDISATLNKLKPRLEAAQKRETTEMLDKLKGVGNSILGSNSVYSLFDATFDGTFTGRFGLSTDNFQFVPNGQGGYSVNFTQ
ncbi:hypothetical protein AMATHDRAFT_202 [Amanita thiersii Skay4041]|uniref:TPR-like protein n=1 Tax=Amanita thiersii Skay4041 TaxID=703135 RepID=A0A2A9P1J5_9AGAR|nr:hypothetical protein AMATHDRAFT_202 [Amanita thiersii Skay4041]